MLKKRLSGSKKNHVVISDSSLLVKITASLRFNKILEITSEEVSLQQSCQG